MNEKSKNLLDKINTFKAKVQSKNEIIVFEPNKFDLLVDDIFNIVSSKYKKSLDKIIVKNLLIKSSLFIKNSLSYFLNSFKNIFKSLNNLEKKIEAQQELLLKTIEFNKELSIKLNKFDEKIHSAILSISQNEKSDLVKSLLPEKINNDTKDKSENIKLNIIQEENLRISNELFESRKKIDIMRQEVEKYNKQRSDLINKINSVNDIIKDSNVLTTVFDNNINNSKIKILDPERPLVNNKSIEEEIKSIFSKKN